MKRLATLLALFLATACSNPGVDAEGDQASSAVIQPASACEATSPRTTPLELFVFPEVGVAPFAEALARATTSIDVMVYQMGTGAVLDGLEAKARAGVRVRVILDLAKRQTNQRYMDRLIAAGAQVIWSDPQFVFMHAKVMIIDQREAIVGTGNYSQSYMIKERNFAIRDSDREDIAVLERLFEADFNRTTPDLDCTRLLVAPVNSRDRLMTFLRSAKKSILIHSMQLGDKEVRDLLAEKKAAGVEVRAVLADPGWIDANAGAAEFLASKNIPARWVEHLHVKSIVIDGEAAYVGSINLSWNSITKNREVGMLVLEPSNVAKATATFESDFQTGKEF